MKKIFLIVEDDWELMGNGLGDVSYHQYLPAYHFLKIANRAGIKISFMIETAQAMKYEEKCNQSKQIFNQLNLWKESIKMIDSMGGDLQLHLHPQWLDAKFENDRFLLSDKWSIGQYNESEQQKLVQHGIRILQSIVSKDLQIKGFKAGSWGLQPSASILKVLDKEGINIVMGVRKGLKIPGIGLDYTNLDEVGTMPYYANYNNITKVGNGNIVVLPLAPYSPDILTFFKYALNNKLSKHNNRDINYLKNIEAGETKLTNPLDSKEKLKFSLKPYTTHLKIGNEKFSYLKKSFDYQMNRLKNIDNTNVLVIETHTKMFHGYLKDIDMFLHYIGDKYGDLIESVNISDLHKLIQNNTISPLKNIPKNES